MVKCANCGFLTLRDKKTGSLVEANDDYRISGKIPDYIEAFRDYHNWPICFAMAYDLMPEVIKAANKQFVDNSDDWNQYVFPVITKERECPPKGKSVGFTDYQQGFTPKEHREMIDRQWLLDFQAKREDKDKKWRDEQRNEDLAWREKQETKADSRHRTELWIIGGVVTVALIVGAIIAAIVERGYLWPFWNITQ